MKRLFLFKFEQWKDETWEEFKDDMYNFKKTIEESTPFEIIIKLNKRKKTARVSQIIKRREE